MVKAIDFITNAQDLIDKANQNSWDTSAIQTGPNVLSSVNLAEQAVPDNYAAIIASYNGFNSSGKVTDRIITINTFKPLFQVLKETRAEMNRKGKALTEAVSAILQDHHPNQTPTAPTL
jgi:hypothetical protein